MDANPRAGKKKKTTKPRRSEYAHLWKDDPDHRYTKVTKWSEEVLDALADRMYDFITSREDIFFVRKFFTKENINMRTMYDVMHRSKHFESTFRLCQQICADRVHDGVLKKKLDGSYAVRFMHFFDGQLEVKDQENEGKKLKKKLEITKESDISPDGVKIILEVEKT